MPQVVGEIRPQVKSRHLRADSPFSGLIQLCDWFKIDRTFAVFCDLLKIDKFDRPFGSTLLMLLGEDVPRPFEGEVPFCWAAGRLSR